MKIDRVFLTEAEHVRAEQWMFGLSIEDEEWVSSLGLIEYQMRFGSAYLKMGGIRAVGTRETHRNQGYSRRVMEASIAFMTENGFDVSMLFGISNFYHKFGYATVIPEIWINFRREEAQAAVSTYQIRKVEKKDGPKILTLYAANNAERTGTQVREETRWKRYNVERYHPYGSDFGVFVDPYGEKSLTFGRYGTSDSNWQRKAVDFFVVLDTGDEVIGYFACDATEENCILCDIGFQNETIFETVVRFLADRAKRIGVSQLLCHIPIDHPFAIFCRRYDCRTHIRNWKNSGGMMRIINQSSTLEKITGALEKRLQRNADLSQWRGQILISTDLGQDCLEIDQGSIAHTNGQANAFHLEMPQDKLIQLMMGRRSIGDLAIEPDVSVSAEILPVLDTLFPLDHPHVWWPDRF